MLLEIYTPRWKTWMTKTSCLTKFPWNNGDIMLQWKVILQNLFRTLLCSCTVLSSCKSVFITIFGYQKNKKRKLIPYWLSSNLKVAHTDIYLQLGITISYLLLLCMCTDFRLDSFCQLCTRLLSLKTPQWTWFYFPGFLFFQDSIKRGDKGLL